MKIEKRIIALCICALAIGIATTLPLTYLTPRTAAAQNNPWFNVDILYANVIPNPFGGSGIVPTVVANFTFTPNALNLNGADAKIEVFNFHIYSDKASVANITYCLTLSGNIPDPNRPDGANTAIITWGDGFWEFADGTKYNVKDVIGSTDGSGGIAFMYYELDADNLEENHLAKNPMIQAGYFVGSGCAVLSTGDGEKLEHTSTLYVDVTRVMTVTYNHQTNADSTTSSTTTTLATSEVLSHTVLSKTDFGFASGPVPDFMLNNIMFAHVLPPDTTTVLQPSSESGELMSSTEICWILP
jgi:hypothetical protein